MSPFINILLWIGFAAIFAKQNIFIKKECTGAEPARQNTWLYALLVFLPVIWMAGTRTNVGDTLVYINGFISIPTGWDDVTSYLAGIKKDVGFSFFSLLIKLFVSQKWSVYLFIIAIIQGICVTSIFRKYSCSYICSVFLFIASSDYISWMFNGIRQFLAVVIIFAATPLLLKKKYLPFLAVILLASTFHQSALIMIPIALIAQGEAWNRKTVLFIILVFFSILFVNQFTQYENVVNDYKSWQDDGTNPLRVAVYSVPAVISLVYRKRLRDKSTPLINLCVNMSIISAGLYLISVFTSGIFLGRLPIYVSLYGYILLPWEIKNLFGIQYRKLMYTLLIVLYLMFYYVSIKSLL